MTRSAPTSTYDDDFFAWTQEQAAALRALPRDLIGEGIDIERVAGEIEDLGKRDLREVSSFLVRLFEHMMKIERSPRSRTLRHWRVEALNFQLSARRSFSPGMRRLLAVDRLWCEGAKLVKIADRDAKLPAACPLTLDEILSDDFDLDAALAELAAADAA